MTTPEINGSPIPADHIKFSDDRTEAWWVLSTTVPDTFREMFDRPCSACDGGGVMGGEHDNATSWFCPACGGSGRHCFEITHAVLTDEESTYGTTSGTRTLTVSVVEGMVLPIVDVGSLLKHLDGGCILIEPHKDTGDPLTIYCRPGDAELTLIDLPSHAAPGMWAVKLEVHR